MSGVGEGSDRIRLHLKTFEFYCLKKPPLGHANGCSHGVWILTHCPVSRLLLFTSPDLGSRKLVRKMETSSLLLALMGSRGKICISWPEGGGKFLDRLSFDTVLIIHEEGK